MRMWKVDPTLLCDKHLLGEHVEMHMFAGSLQLGHGMVGFVEKGLVEVHSIQKRHDDLATEMTKRGMRHKSPLTIEADLIYVRGEVDVSASLIELARRCERCRARQQVAVTA